MLRQAGLIEPDRYRYWTYYRLQSAALVRLAATLGLLARSDPSPAACRRLIPGADPAASEHDQGEDRQDRQTEEDQQPPADRRPTRVRPASRIQAVPRPISHSSTSPTTRVDTDTASHQASRPTQPNPFQSTLVCTRRVSPPMVAPDATTGAL